MMFDAKVYVERRRKLREKMGGGILLFPGNEESPMNYPDNPYPFRQDSSFLYFFGIDKPGLTGLVDADSGEEMIFGNELGVEDIVWMGSLPSLREQAEWTGIQRTAPPKELASFLEKARKQGRHIHYLPPYRPENRIKLFHLLDLPLSQMSERASVPLIRAVVAQRSVKSKEEIAEIEKAVDVSADMHIAAMKMARPGMREREMAAEMHRIALAAGGDISFPIILTVNGQTLHNHYHGNIIREGDMVLCDAGAETAMHYAGDLSSTFPVSPRFTERQREIYQITLDAHNAALDRVAPGVPNREVHKTACRRIAAGLRDLGLMKGDPGEAVEAGAHALFFPCGVGHMMGLDVHDMEDLGEIYVGYGGEAKSRQFGLKSLRLARELEPGFVITVEPGIYFIPELVALWESEKRFGNFIDYPKVKQYLDFGGIRNEEDVLVTGEGHRVLGKRVPKSLSEVESLRQG